MSWWYPSTVAMGDGRGLPWKPRAGPGGPSLPLLPPSQGYSFIAPSILFGHNAITTETLDPEPDGQRPDGASVALSAIMKVVAGPLGSGWGQARPEGLMGNGGRGLGRAPGAAG